MARASHKPTTLGLQPSQWPLREPLVLREGIMTLASQAGIGDKRDTAFLGQLTLGYCTGAADCQVYPFLCKLPSDRPEPTARDILDAVGARDFRSKYIKKLDVTRIRYPGYHPDANDEIHNSFRKQYVFAHETDDRKKINELAGAHGELKKYVRDGRLWYVLLHTTRYDSGATDVADFVVLVALGKSPVTDSCVGVVSHQVCHNLCD